MSKKSLLERLKEDKKKSNPLMTYASMRQPTHILASILVLLACLSATAFYWYMSRQELSRVLQETSKTSIQETERAIGSRLEVYGNILTAGKGLFAASGSVSRDEFDTFIESFDLSESYPGTQGFGYGAYVRPSQLGTHIQEVRNSGVSDYDVPYIGQGDHYVPVTYLAPINDSRRKTLGFNMMSEPIRRQALVHARDTGKATFTGKVSLAQNNQGESTNQEAGVIVYMPIYRSGAPTDTKEQRQAAIEGYMYTALKLNGLLRGVFGDEGNPNVALQIFGDTSRSEEQLLYRSSNYNQVSAQPGARINEREINAGGKKMVVSYTVAPTILSNSERNEPWYTLTRGLIISLIVTYAVYYFLTYRTRRLFRLQKQEVQSAKDDLLSLASHQLRTPATVVKQYVGMLLQGYGGPLADIQKEMLENAYSSNERQLKIINQILYVARLEAGQIRLHQERHDLSKFLGDIVKEQSASFKENGHTLELKLPGKPIHALIDEQYLHMVFDNLLGNANKYTPAGGNIRVTLQLHDKQAVIQVADNGEGIPKSERQGIFDKFTRGNTDMTSQVNGSGIGLYLVKRIVELHKGTITVSGNKPQGTIFKLAIPLKASQTRKSFR